MHNIKITDEPGTAIKFLITPGADATMFFMLAFTKPAVIIIFLAVLVDVALIPPTRFGTVAANQTPFTHFVTDTRVTRWPKIPAFKSEMTVLSFGAVFIDAESGVTCIGQAMEVIPQAFRRSFTKRAYDLPQWNTITSEALKLIPTNAIIVITTYGMPTLFNFFCVLMAVIV